MEIYLLLAVWHLRNLNYSQLTIPSLESTLCLTKQRYKDIVQGNMKL